MGKYQADEANMLEAGGGMGFRIKEDGGRVKVVFLYDGPESIDGWACHRFTKHSGVTTVVDCPRSPKDPIDKCPACNDKHTLYTRIFVRMLDLNNNKVVFWDKASSFRRDLVGMMQYFNPLYKQVYEITRRGSGLQTTYQFQSLNESGITPERYQELVAEADKVIERYVRPSEQYHTVCADWEADKEQSEREGVNVQSGNQQAPGAWGAPSQGQGWGQQPAPSPQGWGQPAPQNPYPSQGQGWGQQPAPSPQGWGQQPAQQPASAPAPSPQQPPQAQQPTPQQANNPTDAQGGWAQPPTNWGQPG